MSKSFLQIIIAGILVLGVLTLTLYFLSKGTSTDKNESIIANHNKTVFAVSTTINNAIREREYNEYTPYQDSFKAYSNRFYTVVNAVNLSNFIRYVILIKPSDVKAFISTYNLPKTNLYISNTLYTNFIYVSLNGERLQSIHYAYRIEKPLSMPYLNKLDDFKLTRMILLIVFIVASLIWILLVYWYEKVESVKKNREREAVKMDILSQMPSITEIAGMSMSAEEKTSRISEMTGINKESLVAGGILNSLNGIPSSVSNSAMGNFVSSAKQVFSYLSENVDNIDEMKRSVSNLPVEDSVTRSRLSDLLSVLLSEKSTLLYDLYQSVRTKNTEERYKEIWHEKLTPSFISDIYAKYTGASLGDFFDIEKEDGSIFIAWGNSDSVSIHGSRVSEANLAAYKTSKALYKDSFSTKDFFITLAKNIPKNISRIPSFSLLEIKRRKDLSDSLCGFLSVELWEINSINEEKIKSALMIFEYSGKHMRVFPTKEQVINACENASIRKTSHLLPLNRKFLLTGFTQGLYSYVHSESQIANTLSEANISRLFDINASPNEVLNAILANIFTSSLTDIKIDLSKKDAFGILRYDMNKSRYKTRNDDISIFALKIEDERLP